MKRKKEFEISPKYVLLTFTILCVVLFTASVKFKDAALPFRAVAGTVIVPMQKGINTVGSWLEDGLDKFQNIKDLQMANDELKTKVDNLQMANKALQQDKYELERLRKLYDLDQKYSEYDKVASRIISAGSSNWFNTFVIDKGYKDGLAVDMNVIADSGLVGIVTEVGPNYAKVRSIIDDSSNVSAMFTRTSDRCTLIGSQKQIENGYIDVININKDAKVKNGDELVTSSISSKFLPGITIGTVSDIKMDSSNLVKTAKVTPVVDFKHLQEVLVIKQLKTVVK